MLLVNIGKYMGFCVYRRSYLLWPPVIVRVSMLLLPRLMPHTADADSYIDVLAAYMCMVPGSIYTLILPTLREVVLMLTFLIMLLLLLPVLMIPMLLMLMPILLVPQLDFTHGDVRAADAPCYS